MDFDLGSMWEEMGFLAKAVAGTLLAMGCATMFVALERGIVLWRARVKSRAFARALGPLLERGAYDEARKTAAQYPGSPLAGLLGAGLGAYADAPQTAFGPGRVELARRELARRLEHAGAAMRRGLGVLASIGSVAPFVGLFGTVVGIISAFQGIARTGSGGIGSVAGGIAEALVVTGLGLAVAVPAVLVFNMLSTKVDGLKLALETAAGELVDHLETRGDEGESGREEDHVARAA